MILQLTKVPFSIAHRKPPRSRCKRLFLQYYWVVLPERLKRHLLSQILVFPDMSKKTRKTKLTNLYKASKICKSKFISWKKTSLIQLVLLIPVFLRPLWRVNLGVFLLKNFHTSYFCWKKLDFKTPSWIFGQRLVFARMRSSYSDMSSTLSH